MPYGASIGDTGVFDGGQRGIVKAIAIWGPYEHVVVFFVKKDLFLREFKSCRMVLTEKKLDFRISSEYNDRNTLDFCGHKFPEFVEPE